MKASSPASSGPAGSHFEGQVGAHYLLSLLTRTEPRGLPGSMSDRVAFQRGAEGHPLDDIIVRAHNGDGTSATLEIQVKRGLKFTPSDSEFRKVVAQIAAASHRSDFFTTRYELAIAVARSSHKIDGPYQDVLTWARQIGDAQTFIDRIQRPGSANNDMRAFVETFRSNLKEAGAPDDDQTVWRLLSKLQILVFDFTAQGSQSEELVKERAARALHPDDSARAVEFWHSLVGLAIEVDSSGGDRTRDRLVTDMTRRSFRLAGDRRYTSAYNALAEASHNALNDIVDRVGSVMLMRSDRLAAVRTALDEGRYIEIRGDAGVGKSGLLKHLAQQLSAESQIIVLSPGRTTRGGWTAMRTVLGFEGTARDLLLDLVGGGGGALFIDGLDFFADEERWTVVDLVREAANVPGFTVIATARREPESEEPNWLPEQALDTLGRADPVVIEELSEPEIAELRHAAPDLVPLLTDTHPAHAVARNLFRLARLSEQPETANVLRTEIDMAKQWWRTADGKQDDTHRNRSRLLRALAERALSRAEPMDVSTQPSDAVDALIATQTLRDLGEDRVAFRHDVFRDWAIANFLFSHAEAVDRLPLNRPAPASLIRGIELTARMYLERDSDVSRWQALLGTVSREGAHGSWHRAVLLAIVRSEIGSALLEQVSSILFADRAGLLRELIRMVKAVEVQLLSDTLAGVDTTKIPADWNVPSGPSWYRLLRWLLSLEENLPAAAIPDVAALYMEWSFGTMGSDLITPVLLGWLYRWLTAIETDREGTPYYRWPFGGELEPGQVSILEDQLRSCFLCFCEKTPSLAADYLRSLMRRRHRDSAVRSVLKYSAVIARAAPTELAALTIDVLIPNQGPNRHWSAGPFGFIDHEFFPPSPSHGPFFHVLTHAPDIGLRLIRRIVDHAIVSRTNGQPPGSNKIVITFPDGGRAFPWLQSYTWPRDWGRQDSCVTSALMALEVWAHRRVESGDAFEEVLADVLGPADSPAAYLLVAVDLLISHWPASREAAVPFLACPELLCLDLTRPRHDHSEIPNVFWIESLAEEPVGPASLDSLKRRPSRQCPLGDLLGRYAVSGPSELRETLTALLSRAAEQLGPYGERSDLSDPKFMAIHARNQMNSANWKKTLAPRADGTQIEAWQYVSPPAEEQHLASVRETSSSQLENLELQAAINQVLDDPSHSSPELAAAAVEWAQRQAPTSSEDETDENWVREQTVVAAALIAMRDGDAALRSQYEAWARSIFDNALQPEEDPTRRFQFGFRFNPMAIAFVGRVHLLRNQAPRMDIQALLEAAVHDNTAIASGFGVAASTLAAIDERLVRAVLRLAFVARVHRREDWFESEEQSAAPFEWRRDRTQLEEQRALQREWYRDQTRSAVAAELSWLAGERDEPAWPAFPTYSPDIRDDLRRAFASPSADEHDPPQSARAGEYVDYQGAALWLGNAANLFDVSVRPWLRDLSRTYAGWTAIANGAGLDRDEQVGGIPMMVWNAAYFDLLVRCVPGMKSQDIDELALTPIKSLPDESFFDVVACLLRSVDQVYFGDCVLDTPEAVRIRSSLADRLTSSGGWHRLRDKRSMSIETHLGEAVAKFFLNEMGSAPRCYLLPIGVDRLDPFIPVLEQLVASGPSLFVALFALNLVEVSPRPTHLVFMVTAAEAWLAKYPDDTEFWVNRGIGKRLCALIDNIHGQQQSLLGYQDRALRGRVDVLLAALVGLGVPEAVRLEQTLAANADESG